MLIKQDRLITLTASLPFILCFADRDFTKITPVLLKSTAGEFELESILFLKLRNLASLRLLLVLNLSSNRISNLEPISNCDSLQSLNVAGNLISSIDNLKCLQSLRQMESIRLKDNTYNYTNPVCKNSSYRNILLEIFPNLKAVDGERVVGQGSDLYQLCKDIDDTIKAGMLKNGQIQELPECKPWVEDGFWEIKRSNNAIIEEACKQFNDILSECRLLNHKAAHVITQTERTLSSSAQPKQYTV
ncbi:leucine-rich repeat-containing protein 61-like isoform X3 [Conger conger]|uniref:leucine-rich repeat-containing protein 61-like isoform X3 n=1 Tax=Conger conger TaxID=82655 RepID=UPI002A5A6F6E|nr:leucine-rich repeat-containing protein 61-like isoform X3 [Conger conger]